MWWLIGALVAAWLFFISSFPSLFIHLWYVRRSYIINYSSFSIQIRSKKKNSWKKLNKHQSKTWKGVHLTIILQDRSPFLRFQDHSFYSHHFIKANDRLILLLPFSVFFLNLFYYIFIITNFYLSCHRALCWIEWRQWSHIKHKINWNGGSYTFFSLTMTLLTFIVLTSLLHTDFFVVSRREWIERKMKRTCEFCYTTNYIV